MERDQKRDSRPVRAKARKTVTLGVVVRCWHTLPHNEPNISDGKDLLTRFAADSASSEKVRIKQTFVRDVQGRGARGNRRATCKTAASSRKSLDLADPFHVRAPLNKFCSAVAACLHFTAPNPLSPANKREERCALMGLPNS
jgi:hypothetical protein